MDSADLIASNVKVKTLRGGGGTAEALAIRGEKFLAIGGEAEVMLLAGTGTRLVDASERPGAEAGGTAEGAGRAWPRSSAASLTSIPVTPPAARTSAAMPASRPAAPHLAVLLGSGETDAGTVSCDPPR
jgi:hypothetical protein